MTSDDFAHCQQLACDIISAIDAALPDEGLTLLEYVVVLSLVNHGLHVALHETVAAYLPEGGLS